MTVSYEFIDRRALAALQFVDVTGAPVLSPIGVEADGATFFRKGGGRVAVMTAPGLDAHADAFEIPPPTPALGTVTVQVDVFPADRGLAARRFALQPGDISVRAAAPVPPSPVVGRSRWAGRRRRPAVSRRRRRIRRRPPSGPR